MFNNIPYELQLLNQWCVWRYETTDNGKKTKIPCTVRGYNLSVTNSLQYTNFENVCRAVNEGKFDGIGIVLTEDDPYCVIDLDHIDASEEELIATQRNIVTTFANTYAEYSPSGLGLHIICRAKIGDGRKRKGIEMYSQKRFITMTGNVFANKPISDCQAKVTGLYQRLGKTISNELIHNQMQSMTDEELYNVCCHAKNGDKFLDLWQGNWERYYASQSEADFALIDILSHFSRNAEQIDRMFMYSALSKRDKAQRKKYRMDMIKASFDNYIPPIDFEALTKNLKESQQKYSPERLEFKILTLAELFPDEIATIEERPFVELDSVDLGYPIDTSELDKLLPKGLVRDIAKFIYAQSQRPVAKIAIIGAMGMMAGICGRAYNVSSTGLNNYFVLLAKTGVGKESMSAGINKLFSSIRPQQPQVEKFLGLNELVSGSALLKYLSEHSNSFLSIQGEFGLKMKAMSSKTVSSHLLQLRRIILDLYNKSGATDRLQSTVYADSAKKIDAIQSPAFSILGESTPETFYEALSDGLVEEGLMSRFTVVEYDGIRVASNKHHGDVVVPEDLKNNLLTLCSNVLTLNGTDKCIKVNIDEEADKIFDDFDVFATKMINESINNSYAQLWNRAHLKALKLSALMAVGQNIYMPTINAEVAKWAVNFVTADVNNMIQKYRIGVIGVIGDENAQLGDVAKSLVLYFTGEMRGTNKENHLRTQGVISYRKLYDLTRNLKSIRRAMGGSKLNIYKVIMTLEEMGLIEKIKKVDMISKFNLRGDGYAILNLDGLQELTENASYN